MEVFAARLLVILLVACGGDKTVRSVEEGSGDMATEDRDLEPFSEVEGSGNLTLLLTMDPDLPQHVAVGGDDNLLDNVRTEVDVGVLVVSIAGDVSPVLDLEVDVHVPALTRADASTGTTLSVSGVEAFDFAWRCDTDAACTLKGEAGDVEGFADDGAVVDAEQLTTGTTNMHVHGGSTAAVCVTTKVTGTVRESSVVDLYCGGHDALDVDTTSAVTAH